jgi:hypothetical protein
VLGAVGEKAVLFVLLNGEREINFCTDRGVLLSLFLSLSLSPSRLTVCLSISSVEEREREGAIVACSSVPDGASDSMTKSFILTLSLSIAVSPSPSAVAPGLGENIRTEELGGGDFITD